MLALLAIVGDGFWRRRLDDVTLLAATVRSRCSATHSFAA
jgi:hypothetical protein